MTESSEPRTTGRTTTWVSDPADAPLRGCTFGQAVRRYFGRYAKFSGRSSRSEYWKVNPLVGVVLLFGQLAASGGIADAPFGTKVTLGVIAVFWAVTFVPSLALAVRRLHDANFSGWWMLLTFVPLLGGLIVLILLTLDSNPVGERFDEAILRADDSDR